MGPFSEENPVSGSALMQYAEPLMERTDGSIEQTQKALNLAMLCWNLALFPESRSEVEQEMMKSLGETSEWFDRFRQEVIEPMIRRHREMFPEMHRRAAESHAGPESPVRVERLDDRSYEVSFQRCFVQENITKAGIADHYVCAVFDRVAGWHDALGLPLDEEPAALPCAKAQGKECRRTMTIQ